MSATQSFGTHPVDQRREPIFNVPPVVVGTIATLVLVHVVHTYFLAPEQDIGFLLTFAFIPARYDATPLVGGAYPGGFGAEIWTFVTYAFIHADLVHLGVNSVWLLAFGSALARRFGTARFLAFFAVTAAAGAAAHLLAHAGDPHPTIGASASISGAMAAAMRFAFQRGGPLGLWRGDNEESYRVPAAPLSKALRDPRVLGFLLAWFGINALFGLGSMSIFGDGQVVAWQAHIGGFIAGLILFALFDPVPRAVPAD
jgi:membrane associated rhomboid family serine protease